MTKRCHGRKNLDLNAIAAFDPPLRASPFVERWTRSAKPNFV
jgi:hypothetical protein